MNIHVFGATTPTGFAFRECVLSRSSGSRVFTYSRTSSLGVSDHCQVDLSHSTVLRPLFEEGENAILLSFAPIWLIAPFLNRLASSFPDSFSGLRGVIACSSSSVTTKRFASNRFDRELVMSLADAEDQLLATCRLFQVPCHILQPSLIYGQAGPYGDRNLSRLLEILRWLPILPIPSQSGLRQPIHASQLAAVAFHLADQLDESGCDPSIPERITLGGDTTLTYFDMIRALQKAQSPSDPARRCWLIPIPNRFFFYFVAPLLLCSPKGFEAVLRMGSSLSGFTPAHQLLGCDPQPFPVIPLA